MINKTTIKFSRDQHIEESYDVAIIKLNTYSHTVGEPVVVRYYDTKKAVKSIIAVGRKDGPGRENYEILSNGSIEALTGAYNTRFPDVASLVNDEVYLCYDEYDKPSYCIIKGETKCYVQIKEDATFYSGLDGFFWYVTGGIIRRSDSLVSDDVLSEAIKKLIENGTITVTPERKQYSWSLRENGNVSEKYAKVFSIPVGTSVILSVTSTAMGDYNTDIITYDAATTGVHGYTSGRQDFYAAGVSKSSRHVEPAGMVVGTNQNPNVPKPYYTFTYMGGTCKEDDITWHSGVGFSAEEPNVTKRLTLMGSSDSPENLFNLGFGYTGTVSVNSVQHKNFLANTEKCKDKLVAVTFTEVDEGTSLYRFFISQNIKGMNLFVKTDKVLEINRKLYSGSIVTVTSRISTVNKENIWTYNITESEIYSSDGSVNIQIGSDGRKDLTVTGGDSAKSSFWFFGDSNTLKNQHKDEKGNDVFDWVYLLDIPVPEGGFNEKFLGAHSGITFDIKRTVYTNSRVSHQGRFSISLNNITGSIKYLLKSWPGSSLEFLQFIRSSSSSSDVLPGPGIEFAVVREGDLIRVLFRTVNDNKLPKYEFSLLTSLKDWSWSSESWTPENPTPYLYNSDETLTRNIENFLIEDSLGNLRKDTEAEVKRLEGLIEKGTGGDLAKRVETLENTRPEVIKVNGDTLEAEVFEDNKVGIDLGAVFTPENTYRLEDSEEIDGRVVPEGSLVYVDPDGEKTVLSNSSNNAYYRLVANTKKWWKIGSCAKAGVFRVKVTDGIDLNIIGDIYKVTKRFFHSSRYITLNPDLVGYIKVIDDDLYVRGSAINPYTVELEDFTGVFNFIGGTDNTENIVPNSISCSVPRESSILTTSIGISSTAYDGQEYILSGNRNSYGVDFNLSECCYICFRVISGKYQINLKDEKSSEVKLTLDGLIPGYLYTVTYKKDEFICSRNYEERPLTSFDLGRTAESVLNKTTEINELSTNSQYPTAKAVWDMIKSGIGGGSGSIIKSEIVVNSERGNYKWQGALIVDTLPTKVDVYWTAYGKNFSDTLYISGNPDQPDTYRLKVHNSTGVFSLTQDDGDIILCIPSKTSSAAPSIAYHFVPTGIGSVSPIPSTSSYYDNTIASTYVGNGVTLVNGEIYNLKDAPSVSDFEFNRYDSVIISYAADNITIQNNTTSSLPDVDKIFTIVNNSRQVITSLLVSGINANGVVGQVVIPQIQPGATITLTYIAVDNNFTYESTLQGYYSPDHSIDIVQEDDQWAFSLAGELKMKIDTLSGIDPYTKPEVDALIKTETDRATAAENENSRAITTEAGTRQTEDERLQGLIDAHQTESNSRFTTIEGNITTNLQLAKEYADSVASGAMKWKGVKTWEELQALTGQVKGDFYTISDKENSEYAWTGTDWEFIGSNLDFTEMKAKIETNKTNIENEVTRATTKETELEGLIRTKADSDKVYTKEEINTKLQYITNEMLDELKEE